jgi:hypothetical protein
VWHGPRLDASTVTNEDARRLGGELRARFPDAVVLPGDDRWDAARMAFNVLVDQEPVAVARPASAAEAAQVVAAAADLGLQVNAQGSSHNPAPLGSLEGVLLMRLDRMRTVEIDAEACTARVEAGVPWSELVPRASELGLAALHGSSPEINIVGYSLGGGVGWQARKRGLQANSLTAIEVVTADGEARRVDATDDPDLFWALRGGGGDFGVVTAIEFRLYRVPEIYGGALFYPFERGAEVLEAWRDWTTRVPEECTTSARLLQFPPLEDLPELVRGKSFAVIDGAILGPEKDAEELLRPLRDLEPVIDRFASGPPATLAEIHMDPTDPIPWRSTHALVDSLEPGVIEEAAEIAATGPVPVFELRHTGGALARPASDGGALASIPGEYMLIAIVPVMDPAQEPGIQEALARVDGAFAAHDVGRYPNFAEARTDPARMFPPGALSRLREVKTKYDPGDVIRANHQLSGEAAQLAS